MKDVSTNRDQANPPRTATMLRLRYHRRIAMSHPHPLARDRDFPLTGDGDQAGGVRDGIGLQEQRPEHFRGLADVEAWDIPDVLPGLPTLPWRFMNMAMKGQDQPPRAAPSFNKSPYRQASNVEAALRQVKGGVPRGSVANKDKGRFTPTGTLHGRRQLSQIVLYGARREV